MSLELETVASGYNLDKIQSNFDKIEYFLNNMVLKREIVEGEEQNEMRTHLDMNQNMIVNTSRVIDAATLDKALELLEEMGYDIGT